MPFTFSHPALILPLTYLPPRWFSLTGLVIGSLTPDFEYFIRMKIQSNYSHTLSGLFWFDLPLGILLAFLFHNIVRDQLFCNLPVFLKSRVLNFTAFNWNRYFLDNWFVVLISILVGATSHILWDGFTHEHGFFVERFSALRKQLEFSGIQLPVSKIIQHASTLIGGLIVAFAIWKLPADKAVNGKINYKYWILVMLISSVILTIRFFAGLELKEYGSVLVSCISAGLIALVLSSMFVKARETTTRK
ncbi:MAG: DUF4184 family protein [Bacteroidota bacterium]|nr:DUF4184 family protein [Bacteroidota bacterium]